MLFRSPLRERNEVPRAETKHFNMRDRAQRAENVIETLVGVRERVAPGDHDVADLRMLADIIEGAVELLPLRRRAGIGNLALARTETAVHRTVVGRVKKNAIRITMREAGHRHVALFGEGILEVFGGDMKLAQLRHRLHRGGPQGHFITPVPVSSRSANTAGQDDDGDDERCRRREVNPAAEALDREWIRDNRLTTAVDVRSLAKACGGLLEQGVVARLADGGSGDYPGQIRAIVEGRPDTEKVIYKLFYSIARFSEFIVNRYGGSAATYHASFAGVAPTRQAFEIGRAHV